MQLTNANIRKGAKQYYEEHIDEYQDARDEAFDEEFKEEFSKHFGTKLGMHISIDEDDVQGFLDSFEFKDEDEWLSDMYESHIGDLIDQAYDSYKDDRLEMEDV